MFLYTGWELSRYTSSERRIDYELLSDHFDSGENQMNRKVIDFRGYTRQLLGFVHA